MQDLYAMPGHLIRRAGQISSAIFAEELAGRAVSLDLVCDIIIGSIVKRMAAGKSYGLAVLAEGLIESIGEKGLLDALGDELARLQADAAAAGEGLPFVVC